ncbi:MAG: ECF-type sigma factor [Acidobacteriota bacterium]
MSVDADGITRILERWSDGDQEALDQLTPLVFDELRRLARCHFAGEVAGHTLQPTALVSEVFVRILGRRKVQWTNRNQFFGAATELMRRILVDHARRRQAKKRGPGLVRIELDETPIPATLLDTVDVVALHEAMDRLDPQRRFIVERKVYFGLTHRQIGDELGLAADTVKEKWAAIRARLYRDLHTS